jgi:elongation factor P--(R)-beta-lysine ligase
VNELDWYRHFKVLKDTVEATFSTLKYSPIQTRILQSTIGFDPTNNVLKIQDEPRFLRTSPELNMKIALQKYQASLYEIGKVFRGGKDNATGPIHREEFWMCEFYKIHASLEGLIQDIQVILKNSWQVFRSTEEFKFTQVKFNQIFQNVIAQDLTEWLAEKPSTEALDELDFIYADKIQPALNLIPGFVLLTHFPTPLSALAQVSPETKALPPHQQQFLRAELSFDGIELLNAYQEIEDFEDLTERLSNSLAYQRHEELNRGPLMDDATRYILEKGIPKSSGCALGLDRYLMILLKLNELKI